MNFTVFRNVQTGAAIELVDDVDIRGLAGSLWPICVGRTRLVDVFKPQLRLSFCCGYAICWRYFRTARISIRMHGRRLLQDAVQRHLRYVSTRVRINVQKKAFRRFSRCLAKYLIGNPTYQLPDVLPDTMAHADAPRDCPAYACYVRGPVCRSVLLPVLPLCGDKLLCMCACFALSRRHSCGQVNGHFTGDFLVAQQLHNAMKDSPRKHLFSPEVLIGGCYGCLCICP